MDAHEKLKVARSIKEEGNDYFKRGKLPEAQKSYTKVLDMLREEIIFTGDDQKKERQSLILAAHLNLAQCALQLGDDVKVIDHCNIALGLDSDNVKAHFRKAKAFENLSEYAKALEGYQTVLRLEPNNSAAQKQQSECQKKFARERSMDQMSDNTGVIEVEEVSESFEENCESRYKKCKKNPGHEEFIDVTDFEINHLPPDYRDEELFDLVKHQIQLTVLVEVKGSSEHRPDIDPKSGDKYPLSGKRFGKSTHYGTGWVRSIILNEEEKLCPCTTCQSSELPEKLWAKIAVRTAQHVVYDEIEAKNTICYFFYENGIPLQKCPKICDGMEVIPSGWDDSILMFISHDQNLINILHSVLLSHVELTLKTNIKYNGGFPVRERTDILENYIQTLQRADELLTELWEVIDKSMAIYNGDPATEYEKNLERQRTTGVSNWLGDLLLDKLNGGSKFQCHMQNLSRIYKAFKTHVSQTKSAWFYNAIRHGHLPLTEQIKGELEADGVRLDLRMKQIERILGHPLRLNDYNEAHPLAIIVSHPHGHSKKISIGKVTDKIIHTSIESLSRFTYTTPTCPGSSGASVFILGQTRSYAEPVHSSGKPVKPGGGQQNMSAFKND